MFIYLDANFKGILDEKYIIAGLKNRDKTIFDFVFSYYYSGLCAYARRWVDDKDVAEDLVQDFFVKLWINNSKIEINSSLKSYFFTSIKNRSVNHLKHVKIEEKFGSRILNSPVEENSNWEFTESELVELIEKAMQKLPPRCREIFALSRFEGVNNADIAVRLGISKRTVELQVSNALKILRTELQDYLPSMLLFWILK